MSQYRETVEPLVIVRAEGSRLYGTSLILQDTDDDLRTDPEEIFGSWVIQPCKMVAGETVQDLPREVTSSPTHTDFDLDGVVDGAEMLLLTDPLDADTDDDGKIDNPAVDPMPNGCGEIMVTVKIKSYDIHGVSGQCGVIPGDFKLVFRVNTPTSTVTFTKFKYIWGLHPKIDLDFVATFPLREWEEFSITGTFTERDPLFGNEWWKLEERAEVQWDALEVTSLSNPSQTIYSVGSETNNQCFDNHRFTVEITSVVAP